MQNIIQQTVGKGTLSGDLTPLKIRTVIELKSNSLSIGFTWRARKLESCIVSLSTCHHFLTHRKKSSFAAREKKGSHK